MRPVILFAALTAAVGQGPAVTRLGPQVGQAVPDFSLVDQTGKTHTLKSILGPNGGVLVFFRSADW